MTRAPVITPDRCLRLPAEIISHGIWPGTVKLTVRAAEQGD
jgi:hypothetical protein